jgi:hypothetical protein
MVRSVPANPNQGAWVPRAALAADLLLVPWLVCPRGNLPRTYAPAKGQTFCCMQNFWLAK